MICGCVGKNVAVEEKTGRIVVPEYAENFYINYMKSGTELTVISPFMGSSEKFRYLLVPKEEAKKYMNSGYDAVIPYPVENIVSLSSPNITFLEILGKLDVLKAVDTKRNIYNGAVIRGIEEGKIAEVGEGPLLDIEKLFLIAPDVVISSRTGGSYDSGPEIENAGIPVLFTGEWNERTPLGRAEWIKFFAALTGEEGKGDRFFKATRDEYGFLKEKAAGAGGKKNVLMNSLYNDCWIMPGSESYISFLLKESGGRLMWENNSKDPISLSPEEVFSKADMADCWLINSGSIKKLDDIKREGSWLKNINAVKTNNVYNNDKLLNENGVNAYWETSPAMPQYLLSDFIKIFHPELFSDRDFYYYRKLK